MPKTGRGNRIYFVSLLLAVSLASVLPANPVMGNSLLTTISTASTRTISFTSTTTITTTSTGSSTSTTQFVTTSTLGGPFDIGYIGCSNTEDSVVGYQNIVTNPNQKRFWLAYNTSAGTLDQWADANSVYWMRYQQQLATYGQPKIVWVQICEHVAVKLTTTMLIQAFKILRSFSPNATFYVSPLNTYSPVGLCSITGPNGIQDATSLDKQAVSHGLALQGPIMGPLTTSTTISDNCHPNQAGEQLLGTELKVFFTTR